VGEAKRLSKSAETPILGGKGKIRDDLVLMRTRPCDLPEWSAGPRNRKKKLLKKEKRDRVGCVTPKEGPPKAQRSNVIEKTTQLENLTESAEG